LKETKTKTMTSMVPISRHGPQQHYICIPYYLQGPLSRHTPPIPVLSFARKRNCTDTRMFALFSNSIYYTHTIVISSCRNAIRIHLQKTRRFGAPRGPTFSFARSRARHLVRTSEMSGIYRVTQLLIINAWSGSKLGWCGEKQKKRLRLERHCIGHAFLQLHYDELRIIVTHRRYKTSNLFNDCGPWIGNGVRSTSHSTVLPFQSAGSSRISVESTTQSRRAFSPYLILCH
jgi:hypothetical protein